MSDLFEHFTIVSNIVKYVSWDDIDNFKTLNSLCSELCEREQLRRCSRILNGHLKLIKNNRKTNNKRIKLVSDEFSVIKANFQCKKPKLVMIMSNTKEISRLESILVNLCDSTSTICYVYSKHGNIGCNNIDKSKKLQLDRVLSSSSSSSRRDCCGFSWLCFPSEIEAELLTQNSEVKPNTKLVIVLNESQAKDDYRTRIFDDCESIDNPVVYAGGLVNSINLFNHRKSCFERFSHISIAISGEKLHVDQCVVTEEEEDIFDSPLKKAFDKIKLRNDQFIKSNKIKYQCILMFSCYARKNVQVVIDGTSFTEYDAFSTYFPGIPILGVLCEGEIFHINDGVVKLVRRLYFQDIQSITTIFLLLSWIE